MIEIAKILKAQGVRGEIKAQLYSDNFEGFEKRGFAYIKSDGGSNKRIEYAVMRSEPPFVYIHIPGIDTRNDAEELCGVFLYLEREELDEPEEGEYYIVDFIGIEVMDESGKKLGVIKDVLQHGAADVYEVKGERNFMFPAIKKVVKSIDIKQKRMIVGAGALEEVAVYDDI
jgi:16S rRNA processing protein RimM